MNQETDDMKEIEEKKKAGKKHISGRVKRLIILAAAVLFELLICNFRSFTTMGLDPEKIDLGDEEYDIYFEKITRGDGYITVDEDNGAFIEIDGLDEEVSTIYIDIRSIENMRNCSNEAVDLSISMTDDSHTRFYTPGGLRPVSCKVEKSKYIVLHPMGNLQSIRINIKDGSAGAKLGIGSVTINKKIPLYFSLLRVILIALFTALLLSIRPVNGLFGIKFDPRSDAHYLITAVMCTLLALLLIYFTDHMTQYAAAVRDPYNLLAHAMADGRVNLDVEFSDLMGIAECETPYVPDSRDGYSYNWDSAFYEGHYYVYYGVVPELLIYLPHYLITGRDLNIKWSIRIELLLIIGAGFMLLRLIAKRFKPIPLIVWMLLLAASLMGMYIVTLSKVPTFYYMPPAMALVMTLWGLYFWLSALPKEGAAGYNTVRIALGSLCMAMVLGCRPQMVLGSALAIPIFMNYFVEKKEGEFTPKNTAKYLLAGALPYVVVFIPLMYYNYIRFGSPFEFGAQYNLTAIDVTNVTADAGKLIPGLFTYWLRPAHITAVFPFIRGESLESSYVGDVFSHQGFGGIFICNPLLFFMFAGMTKKGIIKDLRLRLFVIISASVGAVICVINLMVGGFMPRYLCDSAPFFFAAALPVVFTLVSKFSAGFQKGSDALQSNEGTNGDSKEKNAVAEPPQSEDQVGAWIMTGICLICIAMILYHFFNYYTLEDGSQFAAFDRDAFIRASKLFQWWE